MIKVSIVVPIYNVENYLERCLDSLVNQTMREIQIILVNDGSTDSSTRIAKEYAKKYKDKIMYIEKENGGLSDARNYGIKYAKGEYIAFLDSDDYVENSIYEQMYKLAKKDDSDLVECNFIWEYPNKSIKDEGIEYYNKNEMIQKIRVVAWNKLIKKHIIDTNKLEFPKGYRYEDVEFTYKLIPYIKNISFCKDYGIHYVQRQGSITNNQNEKNNDIFIVLNNVLNFYKKIELYDKYQEDLEYTYSRYLLCSSLLRIVKISDKKCKKMLLNKTWSELNSKFPNWKKNKILASGKKGKDLYMKTVNRFTFKLYCKILCIIKK